MENPDSGWQNKRMQTFTALFLLLLLSASAWADSNQFTIKVAPDVDVPISAYGASRQRLILWLPSEHGVVGAEHEIAHQLANRGYAVWVADLFTARFLPIAPSSLNEIPATDVAQLIRTAARRHAKIYLLSSGQGAGRALEGAQLWQTHHRAISGAILLFPNLYAASPEAGEAPSYLPIVGQSRLPIAILQGSLSPWYWQLNELKTQLELGGARVAIKALPGLRDRFYFREDALPREREARTQLAAAIDDSIRHLPSLKPGKTP